MKNLTTLITIILFAACGPGKKEELQTLKDEVMSIHDEVMPKMGELRNVRKQLMLQADSLMESDSVRAAILTTAADNIGEANESMMQWMRNFEPEFEGTNEEVMQYLQGQKESIQKVKEDMLGSVAKGREVLGN
ncbi:MAG: hypothetical protein RLN88_10250 [Ekhidna sp.]|uniref:hypothetical protein n=1 Tax=Ekhidna sp. TaxID=2608089 RepID=UPI0032ECB502